jgi:putative ABC transport system permease protein
LNKIYYKNELNGILEESSREYSVILNTDKALEIELNSEEIKKIPYVQGIISLDLYYQTEKSQKIIVEVLIYTFMALLTAIATLNIYNIVYFSTLLRKKEFAELKSIGMSNRQINKMFILQGILYAIDSIIWGLSISIGILYINYIIQTSKVQAMVILFHIPWLSILICLIVVYATIFMAIRNARKKIKESNIIDEIKNDNI